MQNNEHNTHVEQPDNGQGTISSYQLRVAWEAARENETDSVQPGERILYFSFFLVLLGLQVAA